MSEIKKNGKHKTTFSFKINLIINLVFAVVIAIVIAWEICCYRDCQETKPNYFNPDEAKFYINNIIIILCPLVDTTVGIAFSAYNDKIYGLTIGEIKETARYSGFSFLAMIIISIFLVFVCVALFYFDLLVSGIVVNIIGLLYCLFFTICDVSLIARSKPRVFGIAKWKYKYEKGNSHKTSISNISENIISFLQEGLKENNIQKDKDIVLTISRTVRDYKKISFNNREINKLRKNFYRKIAKHKRRKTILAIDDYVEQFKKSIRKGIKKIYPKSPQSKEDINVFVRVLNSFVGIIYDIAPCYTDWMTKDDLLKYSSDVIISNVKMPPSAYLCDELKTLISNMMAREGIEFVFKHLKMNSTAEIETCMQLQNLYYDSVADEDVNVLHSRFAQCFDNINHVIFNRDLVDISKSGNEDTFEFSLTVTNTLMIFDTIANKQNFDLDKNFQFQFMLTSILPRGNVGDLITKTDFAYRKYHNLLSVLLLTQTMLSEKIWFVYEINSVHLSIVVNQEDINSYFYLLASFYVYHIRTYGKIGEDFKKEIDAKLKSQFTKILLNIFFYKEGHPPTRHQLLEYLLSMLNLYFNVADYGYDVFDFKLDIIPEKKLESTFNNRTIIRYWLELIDYLDEDLTMGLNTDFDYIRSILGNKYSDDFISVFYEYIDQREKNINKNFFGYCKYFGLNKIVLTNKRKSISRIQDSINSWYRNKMLSSDNIREREKFMIENAANVFNPSDFLSMFDNQISKTSQISKSFSFTDYIDYADINQNSKNKKSIYAIRDKIYETIFNFIYDFVKSSEPSHIHNIDDYSRSDIVFIKKLPYSNRFLGRFNANDEAKIFALTEMLQAKEKFNDNIILPYDLFYDDEAIKINVSSKTNPHFENLSDDDAKLIVSSSKNHRGKDKNIFNVISNSSVDFKHVYVELNDQDCMEFLKGQKVKVSFDLECSFEINPKKIEIYKRR